MAVDTRAVEGGFAEPVFAAQTVFRAVMNGFAEPGRIVELGPVVSAPAPLVPAAAAFLAALADGDTPLWMSDPEGRERAAAAWLRFQTGAPITTDPAAATFAVLPEGANAADWSRFALGTSDYPDRSATLLLPVASLANGTPLRLDGPGIDGERRIAPAGLPAGFLPCLDGNRARFPLGFDLILVQGTAALALPRTTRVREG